MCSDIPAPPLAKCEDLPNNMDVYDAIKTLLLNDKDLTFSPNIIFVNPKSINVDGRGKFVGFRAPRVPRKLKKKLKKQCNERV